MNSIRKWLYKPKKTDGSLLAQFFYADEDLNAVAAELDSFDGRKDPDRCNALVNNLRQCQDKVLNICQMIMEDVILEDRAPRDFRAKFPDDVLQENLAGQLWFGAECLAAGSNILNRELESASMRPLAKALTKSLENVRNLLREQCFRNPPEFTEKICESLKILDRLFAEFELSYVSAMVPVKTVHEYEAQQAITVLFSETLQRALILGLLSQEQVDSCDPALMFTIPRLAIVSGLLIFPDGPLCLDRGDLSDMFRPFRSLLLKIRELLWTLNRSELGALERALCSVDDTFIEPSPSDLVDADSSALVPLRNNKNSHIVPSGQPNSTATRNQHNSSSHSHSHSHHHHIHRHHHHHHHLVHLPAQNTEPEDPTLQTLDPSDPIPIASHAIQDYLDQFYKDFPQCKDFISDLCHNNSSTTPTTTSLDQDDATLAIDNVNTKESNLTDNINEEIGSFSTSTHSLQYSSLTSEQSELPMLEDNHSNLLNPSFPQEQSSYVEAVASLKSKDSPGSSSSNSNASSIPSPMLFKSLMNSRHTLSQESDKPETEQESKCLDWVGQQEYNNVDERDVHFETDLQNCDDLRDGKVTRPTTLNTSTETEGQINKSFTFDDDDVPTPLAEKRIDGETVLVESDISDKPTSHSSSSSRDSGLSSMAEVGTPTTTTTIVEPNVTSDSLSSQGAYGKPLGIHFELASPQEFENNESSVLPPQNSAGGCQLMTVVMNVNRVKPNVTQSQELSLCSGSCCNSECSASIGGESTCETSSFDSECQDDMEIALAMQAAEIASRNEVRARFKSSADLIHRLFICISGVADQLQTNYAADLRSTLKCVFAINATPSEFELEADENRSLEEEDAGSAGSYGENNVVDVTPEPSLNEEHNQSTEGDFHISSSQGQHNMHHHLHHHSGEHSVEVIAPPNWVPDELAPRCMACSASFTVIFRRHHCRNCGKVFCGKCSSNSVPLPRYGHVKPVRVCNRCFMYSVTPFTLPVSSDS